LFVDLLVDNCISTFLICFQNSRNDSGGKYTVRVVDTGGDIFPKNNIDRGGAGRKMIQEKLGQKSRVSLKVPKREIFDRSDFPDFYTIKSLREGDFGVKI
jgi:hypothetical protein